MKKENEPIKDKIIIEIKNLFDEGDDHYESVPVGNLWNNNYIEQKIMVTKMKLYQQNITLMKLSPS